MNESKAVNVGIVLGWLLIWNNIKTQGIYLDLNMTKPNLIWQIHLSCIGATS